MRCAQTASLKTNSINTIPHTAEAKFFKREHLQIRSKNDCIFTARAPWMVASALEAESPLANVVERLDSEHELGFWMRSE